MSDYLEEYILILVNSNILHNLIIKINIKL